MYSRRYLPPPSVSVANGVYIQDINGGLYTTSEWSKSLTPNGLAVVTDSCRFVASLIYYGDAEMSYSEYVCDYPVLQTYNTSNFLPIVASSSTAAYDFEGKTIQKLFYLFHKGLVHLRKRVVITSFLMVRMVI